MSILSRFLSFIGFGGEPESQTPPPVEVTKKELSDLTKRELVERAKVEFGVKLNDRLKKQKLVDELFNLHRKN
jgi:hypothetical protein